MDASNEISTNEAESIIDIDTKDLTPQPKPPQPSYSRYKLIGTYDSMLKIMDQFEKVQKGLPASIPSLLQDFKVLRQLFDAEIAQMQWQLPQYSKKWYSTKKTVEANWLMKNCLFPMHTVVHISCEYITKRGLVVVASRPYKNLPGKPIMIHEPISCCFWAYDMPSHVNLNDLSIPLIVDPINKELIAYNQPGNKCIQLKRTVGFSQTSTKGFLKDKVKRSSRVVIICISPPRTGLERCSVAQIKSILLATGLQEHYVFVMTIWPCYLFQQNFSAFSTYDSPQPNPGETIQEFSVCNQPPGIINRAYFEKEYPQLLSYVDFSVGCCNPATGDECMLSQMELDLNKKVVKHMADKLRETFVMASYNVVAQPNKTNNTKARKIRSIAKRAETPIAVADKTNSCIIA